MWNTATPSNAPTGSTRTPSHLSSDRTSGGGRMKASIGRTTVGPDTTRIAPIRRATPRSMSSNRSATVRATPSQVTTTPTTMSGATTRRIRGGTSRNESRRPASNRITPTATDTNGW